MAPLALIVDGDDLQLSKLRAIARSAGYDVISETSFETARRRLLTSPPAILIANLRLKSFNGIHLAYLARTAAPQVKVIIYDSQDDAALAREVQRAHAFYERQRFVTASLERYLTEPLPPDDRRDPASTDRRTAFRGGRRSMDLEALHSAG
jgi:DNA-binding NtrC family response regulator